MNAASPHCFVSEIDLQLQDKLRQGLLQQGFTLSTPPYTLFAAKKQGVSCTLYTSGKLVVQGKEMKPFIEFYLEPEILQTLSFTYGHLELDTTPRIGVDEAGKGDFFGALCIASVYADEKSIPKLYELGVKDSKKMSDQKILTLKKKIQALCPYHTVILAPETYNALYLKFHNLNRMLAWGHATCIEQLSHKTGCQYAHIDQFAKEHVVAQALERKKLSIDLKQSHKGESDLVIAAASIIARGSFVEHLQDLSQSLGHTLPKGASEKVLEMGRKIIQEFSMETLDRLCKKHFATYERITQQE